MSMQVIEWAIDGIRFVEAEAGGKVLRALHWATFQHHETDVPSSELGTQLQSWLIQQGVDPGEITLLLPRESLVVRQLQLPRAPDDELPDLVRFQSAAKSSLPIDELCLDYLPIRTESEDGALSVMTATIDRRRLQQIRQTLEQAGFTVVRATITPLSTAQFVNKFAGATLGTTRPEMVVFQRESLIELSIFDRGYLVFSHSLVLPEANRVKPLESSLTRSIVSLNQTHPNVSIAQCYYVGTTHDEEVREQLKKRFAGNVSEVSLPGSLSDGQQVRGFETLIGATLPDVGEALRLDLLNPRKKVERPDRRKWYWIAGGSTAALVLLLAYGIFLSKKSTLESSIAILTDSIREIDDKLKAGAPSLDAWQRLDTWSTGQVSPVQVWNLLRHQMPGTDRLYLTELRLQPQISAETEARFTGVGFAKLRNDVDNLYQQLAVNGFRVKPQATSTNSRDPDYPVRFELDLELIRVKPEERSNSTPEAASQAAGQPVRARPTS